MPSLLEQIPSDTKPDLYGRGGVVTELEEEVAELLGKEAALFLPTGIMSQQAALRVHADRRGRRAVAFHPLCHLRTHEEDAFARLHGLSEILAGSRFAPNDPLSLAELTEIKEPSPRCSSSSPSATSAATSRPGRNSARRSSGPVTEEPRRTSTGRDCGRPLPTTPVRRASHWPMSAHCFTRSTSRSTRDSAVSLGVASLGTEYVIDEVSLWRTRHGGRPFMLWPYAASSLTVLRGRRHDMATYFRRARTIAREIRNLDDIDVLPDQVRSPLMHLRFRATIKEMQERAREIAATDGVWTFDRPFISEGTRLQRYEYQIGSASMELSVDETVAIIARLAGRRPRRR